MVDEMISPMYTFTAKKMLGTFITRGKINDT